MMKLVVLVLFILMACGKHSSSLTSCEKDCPVKKVRKKLSFSFCLFFKLGNVDVKRPMADLLSFSGRCLFVSGLC